ncbi:hypothetical protein SLEP1_g14600 [Rubroshorea leprosula]|uniref:Pentatricopeptide repeat-containing protein n=1 Tax=Rubroshorea leprosula TaxID=152421 RepID=A0AAV5IQM6_9ROSI|nr:hypothetical protein SLEP1_g14600 [Rubroshorea leprosula]
MNALKPVSPFRLCSLLRLQKDPNLALSLFQNPNPDACSKKPFRYTLLSYDLIISKLGRAKMFNEMEQILLQLKNDTRLVPNEIIFCNVIKFYGRARLPDHALKVFDEMPSYRCQRTVKSVNSLLDALLNCRRFDKMREVFVGMEKYAFPDTCTYNVLIHACCLNGCMDDAWVVFEEMRRKGLEPNGVTFATLIKRFCVDLKMKEAFKLKEDMVRFFGLSPNAYAYSSLIKGLCGVGEVNLAFELKEEMVKNNIKVDSAIYSTLISGLFKVGRKDEVSGVLEEIRINCCKLDTITYNVMINGFCKLKDFEAAYRILEEMADTGCKPDIISYNSIIGGLCKDGKWSDANDLFQDMPRRGCIPDVVSYRMLFDGICSGLEFKEAALILDEMIFKGYVPHSASINRFVDGLCQEGNINLLSRVLKSLGKGNVIDREIWMMVISKICKEEKLSIVPDLVDTLVGPN